MDSEILIFMQPNQAVGEEVSLSNAWMWWRSSCSTNCTWEQSAYKSSHTNIGAQTPGPPWRTSKGFPGNSDSLHSMLRRATITTSKASPWRPSIWRQSKTHMLFSQLPSTTCSWLQLIPLGWPGGKLYTAILCLWSLLFLLWLRLLLLAWQGAPNLGLLHLLFGWLQFGQRILKGCREGSTWVTSSHPINHQNIGRPSDSGRYDQEAIHYFVKWWHAWQDLPFLC